MSYAVLWSVDDGPVSSGKLTVDSGGLVFEGVASGADARYDLRFAELRGIRVARSPAERLEGRPVLVLDTEEAVVKVAAIGGLGILSELAELVVPAGPLAVNGV